MPQPFLITLPSGSVRLEDTATWVNRFTVPSDTTNAEYMIAQHRRRGHWGCGCRGFQTHRKCKHLSRLGLPCYEAPFDAGFSDRPVQMPMYDPVRPIKDAWRRLDTPPAPKHRRRFALSEEDI